MNKITPMRAMDLENIARELKPNCVYTRNVIFKIYKYYGSEVVEAYIESFSKPLQETLLQKAYNRVERIIKWIKGQGLWLAVYGCIIAMFITLIVAFILAIKP